MDTTHTTSLRRITVGQAKRFYALLRELGLLPDREQAEAAAAEAGPSVGPRKLSDVATTQTDVDGGVQLSIDTGKLIAVLFEDGRIGELAAIVYNRPPFDSEIEQMDLGQLAEDLIPFGVESQLLTGNLLASAASWA